MPNTIFTKNLKLNTLRDLALIACFATISQNKQANSSIEKRLKLNFVNKQSKGSTLNKKSIDPAPKMTHTIGFESTTLTKVKLFTESEKQGAKACTFSPRTKGARQEPKVRSKGKGTSGDPTKNKTTKLQAAGTLPKQSLLDAPFYKSKANFIKKLLVLIKLKKALSQGPTINTRHTNEITAKTFSQNNRNLIENNGPNQKGKNIKKLQIALLDGPETLPRQGVKPFSTVTGFKKFMYNFVKLSQSQLQPGYNRRKYSHSHYNQTLKESTRLSRFYAYLPKNLMKNLCGFAINPTLVRTSAKDPLTLTANQKQLAFYDKVPDKKANLLPFLPLSPAYFLRSTLKNPSLLTKRQEFTDKQEDKPFNAEKHDEMKITNYVISSHRPIPKMVNYLESRLDVILWRNQLVSSIRGARQKLRQGIRLNKGLQKTTSYQTLPGDVFTFDK